MTAVRPPAWLSSEEIGAPVRRVAVQREHALARGVYRFCRRCLAKPALFVAWDRSAKHSEQQHIREAQRGILGGWPDCGLLWPGGTLFVELKDDSPRAKPSARQSYVGNQIIAAGHAWRWASSVSAFAAICSEEGVPLQNNPVVTAQLQDQMVAADIRKQEARKGARERGTFAPKVRAVRATPGAVARVRRAGVLV